MLKLNKKIIIWLAVFLAVFAVASAAPEGTVGARSGPPNDWLSYAKFIFPFALSVAAVLSVIMLIIAGLEMMTASEGMRSDAKEKIQNALFGLAVALGIYLILNTVNPALLNLQINIAGLKVNTQGQGSQRPTTSGSSLLPTTNFQCDPETNKPCGSGTQCVRTSANNASCQPMPTAGKLRNGDKCNGFSDNRCDANAGLSCA